MITESTLCLYPPRRETDSTLGGSAREKCCPLETVPIEAVQHVRRMRGGAQSHLMRCSDDCYYVVKFQNNPQHIRVLANDWLGSRLGRFIGLPMPLTAVIQVAESLLEHTPELRVEIAGHKSPFAPGASFGSQYVISPSMGQVFDYFPESMLSSVRNISEFAGVLALDKWLCNTDQRQVAYWKQSRKRKYTACFIDQGYCFNAGDWDFPDAPLRGAFGMNAVYSNVTGWESFEPWLSKIEAFPEWELIQEAVGMPPEWYGGNASALGRLLENLFERRSKVRELVLEFKRSSRNPFPNWSESQIRGTNMKRGNKTSRAMRLPPEPLAVVPLPREAYRILVGIAAAEDSSISEVIRNVVLGYLEHGSIVLLRRPTVALAKAQKVPKSLAKSKSVATKIINLYTTT
jgi:hypothetical protein